MEDNTLIAEFTNSVHTSATSELLVYVEERGILGDIRRPAPKLSSEAHNRQETPLSVDGIDRHAVGRIEFTWTVMRYPRRWFSKY
jgi:hypothetical protein